MAALHERLRFDTANGQVLDERRRYVLLRADVLMGIFAGLPPAAGEEALRAFGRSVARHGADSVRAYAATVDAAALPDLMKDAAASLGWGRWHFEPVRLPEDVSALRLLVDSSPFAAASPHAATPVCHAIAGMLEALGGALWDTPVEAHEIHCAAVHGGRSCRFVATSRIVAGTPVKTTGAAAIPARASPSSSSSLSSTAFPASPSPASRRPRRHHPGDPS